MRESNDNRKLLLFHIDQWISFGDMQFPDDEHWSCFEEK